MEKKLPVSVTALQQQYLLYIHSFKKKNDGLSPTFRQMQLRFDVKTLSSVQSAVKGLINKGLVVVGDSINDGFSGIKITEIGYAFIKSIEEE